MRDLTPAQLIAKMKDSDLDDLIPILESKKLCNARLLLLYNSCDEMKAEVAISVPLARAMWRHVLEKADDLLILVRIH